MRQSASNKVCCFCHNKEDSEIHYGKFHEKDGIYTHYFCLLLSSNIEQNGEDHEGILGFLTDDIRKELKRGKRGICSYCMRPGATISCTANKCKKMFHLPCGRSKGSLHQFFGRFKSYCHNHRLIQRIPAKISNEVMGSRATCTICFEDVATVSNKDSLWASCCKKNAWFHRDCIQRLALSAGYFFKCPKCNDKVAFKKTMQQYGIFIPEQDASWELEPNAYEDLLERHNNCDAPRCKCSKGRVFNEEGSRWELVLCKLCGSQGVHRGCAQLKWSKPEWECAECQKILMGSQTRNDANAVEEEANTSQTSLNTAEIPSVSSSKPSSADSQDEDIIFLDSDDDLVDVESLSGISKSMARETQEEDVIVVDSDDEVEVSCVETVVGNEFIRDDKSDIPSKIAEALVRENEDIITVEDDSDTEEYQYMYVKRPVSYNRCVNQSLVKRVSQASDHDVLMTKDGAAIQVVRMGNVSVEKVEVKGDVNVKVEPAKESYQSSQILFAHHMISQNPQRVSDYFIVTKRRKVDYNTK